MTPQEWLDAGREFHFESEGVDAAEQIIRDLLADQDYIAEMERKRVVNEVLETLRGCVKDKFDCEDAIDFICSKYGVEDAAHETDIETIFADAPDLPDEEEVRKLRGKG